VKGLTFDKDSRWELSNIPRSTAVITSEIRSLRAFGHTNSDWEGGNRNQTKLQYWPVEIYTDMWEQLLLRNCL